MYFRNIKPLYAQEFSLRLGDLHVRRLRLNRHLPQAERVFEHAHSCAQLLLYLSGNGSQIVAGKSHGVKSGMVFFIPPSVQHSFLEVGGRKPLCLALDLTIGGAQQKKPLACFLNSQELMSVRQALSDLSRWRERVEGIEPREAAAVFRLVDIFLRALGFLSREAVSAAQNAILNASKRALKDPRLQAASLADIASRIGYQADYLNRALKQGCGLTLGQLRSEMRVQKAKRMLSENLAIAAIANAIGFDDANYFSRWFRQLTGLTPTAWRKAEVT